jgi:hypothetical protein
MPSQTRKHGQKRSPKQLEDLEWLRDPVAMLQRSRSFEGMERFSDEDFYKFFEEIGEVVSRSKNRTRSRNRSKTKSKSKNKEKSKKTGNK